MTSCVLRNGAVLDGSGSVAFHANIHISGALIVHVGPFGGATGSRNGRLLRIDDRSRVHRLTFAFGPAGHRGPARKNSSGSDHGDRGQLRFFRLSAGRGSRRAAALANGILCGDDHLGLDFDRKLPAGH